MELVHISQISDEHIRRVEDYLKIGQKVTVKVTSIDPQGRINLTMKKLNKADVEENAENVEFAENVDEANKAEVAESVDGANENAEGNVEE